jgi:hypothetical protein
MLVANWSQIRERNMSLKLSDHGEHNFALNEMDECNAWTKYVDTMMDTL